MCMRKIILFVFLILLANACFAVKFLDCPKEPITVTDSVQFSKDMNCFLPDVNGQGAITVNADKAIIDCAGSTLNGDGQGFGILVNGYSNVRIKDCIIENYDTGFLGLDAVGLKIEGGRFSSNSVYGIKGWGKSSLWDLSPAEVTHNGYIGIKLGPEAKDGKIENSFVKLNRSKQILVKNTLFSLNKTITSSCSYTCSIDCKEDYVSAGKTGDSSHENVISPKPEPIPELPKEPEIKSENIGKVGK